MKNKYLIPIVLMFLCLMSYVEASEPEYSIIHKAIRISNVCWILRAPSGAIPIDLDNNRILKINGLDQNSILDVCPYWNDDNDTIILRQEGKTCQFFKWNGKTSSKLKDLDFQLGYFEDVMTMVRIREKGFLITNKRIVDLETKQSDRFGDPWVVVRDREYLSKEGETIQDHNIRMIESSDLGNYVFSNNNLFIASNLSGQGAIIRIDINTADLSIDYLKSHPVNDIIAYHNDNTITIYYCSGNIHIATTSGLFGSVDNSGKRNGTAIKEPRIAKELKLDEWLMSYEEIPIYGMFVEGNELWACTEDGYSFRLLPGFDGNLRLPEYKMIENIKYAVQKDGSVLIDLGFTQGFDRISRFLVAHRTQ